MKTVRRHCRSASTQECSNVITGCGFQAIPDSVHPKASPEREVNGDLDGGGGSCMAMPQRGVH